MNLERTYMSGDQLEQLIQEMSQMGLPAVEGRWRLKKLNLSFNNMSSLPPTMLARFVSNLQQVILHLKVVTHTSNSNWFALFQVKLNYCALSFGQIEAIFAESLEWNSLKTLEIIAHLSATADEAVHLARLETGLALARKVVPTVKFTMVRTPNW